MIELSRENVVVLIDEKRLDSFDVLVGRDARLQLAGLWETELTDLVHYLALFVDKDSDGLSETSSFLTLSSAQHGYILDVDDRIDKLQAQKQIETDLEIINRESQWSEKESIYFGGWWPEPSFDRANNTLEFGVFLRDFKNNIINRTMNRIVLTRYGHLLINYSLSEAEISQGKPLSYYQTQLNEVGQAVTVGKGSRYQDVDENKDVPSRSRMINLLLSSEIF
ncbi:MAG: hypothetical protein CSA45_03645 [Gammaproteobacteria bacterium]|nr:MAG: hypothetical protein CSA45_03645 [Gammaproteobacteria bacterium]